MCVVPVLPAAWLPRQFPTLRVLKHVHEDGLKLAENHSGNLKVALQSLHAQPEVLREVRHVGPLTHLREELDQTGRESRTGYHKDLCRFHKSTFNTGKVQILEGHNKETMSNV